MHQLDMCRPVSIDFEKQTKKKRRVEAHQDMEMKRMNEDEMRGEERTGECGSNFQSYHSAYVTLQIVEYECNHRSSSCCSPPCSRSKREISLHLQMHN